MENIKLYVEEVEKNRSEILAAVLDHIEHQYGMESINRETCKRDICLIVTAILRDVATDSTTSTIKTGLAYIHAYNAIKFISQKHQILMAIEMLKDKLIELAHNDEDIIELISQRLDILYGIVNEKTIQETRIWALAGKVLPYTALAALVWSHFIGHQTMYETFIVAIATVFFTISVTWWWWAVYKITTIITILKNTQPRFKEMSSRIGVIREDVNHIHKTVIARNVDKSK